MELDSLCPWSRVVLDLPNHELPAALAECWQRSLVAVPVRYGSDRGEFVKKHSRPHAVWMRSGLAGHHGGEPSPPGDAYIVYTSGSTSDPRGVVLTRSGCEHNARTLIGYHGLSAGSTLATFLPLHHVNGLGTWLACHLAGSNLRTLRPSAALGEASWATAAHVVPAILGYLVDDAAPWPEGLGYLLTAAAPLTSDLARRFADLYGPGRLHQGYGTSEDVNFTCLMPQLQGAAWRDAYATIPCPPVGTPVTGAELRLDDSGAILVRSPCLMRCYWDNRPATEVAFRDGWLVTGDVGTIGPDGRLTLHGRSKEIIKRGGVTIYPADACPAGAEFAFSCPSEGLGEDVGVWWRTTNHDKTSFAAAVGRYGAPPVTDTGKPRRTEAGRGVWTVAERPERYEALGNLVLEAARVVTTHPRPDNGSAAWQWDAAMRFREKWPHRGRPHADGACGEVVAAWASFFANMAQGLPGESVFRTLTPGAWASWMRQWPLGVYAKQAAGHLIDRGLVHSKAVVLEVGAGVGNCSALIADHAGPGYLRTDLHPHLLLKTHAPGSTDRYNLDHLPPPDWERAFDVVFGVNALHCAANPAASVSWLVRCLKPRGTLLLAEGNPEPEPGVPWALDAVFGMMAGWWDRGRFRARGYWLDALCASGCTSLGYAAYRAGRHDLGGVVWGTV